MSKGGKIYKRFGLRFATAHRIRKIYRKLKQKPLIYNFEMFLLILSLDNPKKFRIYNLLRKQKCLITSSKHLEFIALYFHKIQEWLESKEYKEQYLDTHHPYPPLLNSKWFIENAESKSDFAPLSYHDISAELAWEMNLPLPRCDMVKFENHGSGSAMNVFLEKMGIACVVYYCGFWGRNAYSVLFRGLIGGARAIVIRDFRINDGKLYALVQKPKIMILNQVRDPISNLKSLINAATKMHKAPLCEDNFKDYYLTNLCNTQLYNALVCLKGAPIEFMDMSQIIGDKTIETLNNIAKIFNVPLIPQSQSEFYMQKRINSKNIISEYELLEFLRQNKKLRHKIKKMLDSHLVLIKAHRLDIVQSWKYYQAFERMCEEVELQGK